jgi:DHA2 family multidrug resistance protein
MTVWLGTLQIILDKGQEADWFEAVWIRWTAALSGVCMIAFIARQLLTRSPIVDLRVLRDRNFASGVGFIFIVGAVLYSMITLLPLFLQTLMGYSAIESGYAMTPRGFGAIVGTFLVGRFGRSLDSRYLIALGFGLLVYSGILFSDITLEVGFWSFAWPNIINGFGVSLLFVPLTTMAMGTLRNEVMGNATGIYNLMRNLGGSVGISLVTTMIARSSQVHRAYLVSHLTPYDAAFTRRVEALQAALTPRLGSYQAGRVALAAIEGTLNTQSALASYVDILRWIALACAFCIPAVFIFRRVRRAAPASAH